MWFQSFYYFPIGAPAKWKLKKDLHRFLKLLRKYFNQNDMLIIFEPPVKASCNLQKFDLLISLPA